MAPLCKIGWGTWMLKTGSSIGIGDEDSDEVPPPSVEDADEVPGRPWGSVPIASAGRPWGSIPIALPVRPLARLLSMLSNAKLRCKSRTELKFRDKFFFLKLLKNSSAKVSSDEIQTVSIFYFTHRSLTEPANIRAYCFLQCSLLMVLMVANYEIIIKHKTIKNMEQKANKRLSYFQW